MHKVRPLAARIGVDSLGLVLYQQGLFPLFRCGLTDYRRDILFICEERGIPEKMLNSMRSGCGIYCFPGSRSYGTD